MKKNIVALFLLLSLYSCGQNKKDNSSQYLAEHSTPVIDSFFASIESGRYKSAIHELLSKNENISLQDSLSINLEEKFNGINEASGKFVSKRLLRKKELGDDLGVYSYLVKYEKKFYRFVFIFYNNGSQVKIYKFSFDDTIDIELEESIKLYIG